MMGKLLQVVARHAFKGVLLGSPNGAARIHRLLAG